MLKSDKSKLKKEEKELNYFLNKRTKGEEGQVSYYGFSEVKKEKLEKQFNFDKFEKTYVLFTNVPWDAALLSANMSFKDVYDWLSYTIELFKNKPNLQLIIKTHPSELRLAESKLTVVDYLNNNSFLL